MTQWHKELYPLKYSVSNLLAALLSSFIPGAGRAYSGRLFDGIMGLWTFYLTGSSAYLAIKDGRPFAGPFLGIMATYVYLGEIYGAWRAGEIILPKTKKIV